MKKHRFIAALLAITLILSPIPLSQRNDAQAAAIAVPIVELVLISGAVGVFVTAYACNGDVRKSTNEAVQWLVDKNKLFYRLSVTLLAPIVARAEIEFHKVQETFQISQSSACNTKEASHADLSEVQDLSTPEGIRQWYSMPFIQEYSTTMTGLFARYGFQVPSRISTVSEVERLEARLKILISNSAFLKEYEVIQNFYSEALAKAIPLTWQVRLANTLERTSKCLKDPRVWKYLLAGLGYWGAPPSIIAFSAIDYIREKGGLIKREDLPLTHIVRAIDVLVLPAIWIVTDAVGIGPYHRGISLFKEVGRCISTGGETSTLDPEILVNESLGLAQFVAVVFAHIGVAHSLTQSRNTK